MVFPSLNAIGLALAPAASFVTLNRPVASPFTVKTSERLLKVILGLGAHDAFTSNVFPELILRGCEPSAIPTTYRPPDERTSFLPSGDQEYAPALSEDAFAAPLPLVFMVQTYPP